MQDDRKTVVNTASSGPTPRPFRVFPQLSGDQPAWFAAYVQVNHEKEVTLRLQQKSLDCFLPLHEKWSKRRDRRKKIQVPLFPGYVFVHTVLDNYINLDILKTPGVVWILRNSSGPLPIPDYQIDSLKIILNQPQITTVVAYLTEGDWVQVVRGPFAGCVGVLIRQDTRKGRLVVNIDIIRQSASVELDVEDVESIPPPALSRSRSDGSQAR